jgi:nitrogen fixation protein NifU and related proteins
MSELTDLYQEVILDHNRRPRNYGPLADADAEAHGHNPLCGDKLTVFVKLANGTVSDIHFVGSGCAISKASASLMTEAIKGKSISEAMGAFDRFQGMLTTPIDIPVDLEGIGKLEALAGVREFPMRVKCATLAWHTLKAALTKSASVARTE